MRCLGLLACLSVFPIGFALFVSSAAWAGAWTKAEGEGLLIITAARRIAPIGSLTGGPISSDANISQIYLEYGLRDGLTIGAKSYVQISTTDLNDSSASLGAFIRKRVWQGGQGGVASVQIGYAHPIDSLLGSAFANSKPGAVPEAHLAGLYGRGWAGAWGNAFISTGAAYHDRGKGAPDDLRFELTTGYAPWQKIMGMISFYGLVPLGKGTDASLRIGPSIAIEMWPWTKRTEKEKEPRDQKRPNTIQFGISYDVLNHNDGLGLSISIWRPF